MARISSKVSNSLGEAIEEAKAKINGEENKIDSEAFQDVKELLESGVKAKRKRKLKKSETDNEASVPEEKEKVEQIKPKTFEEVCEYDIERAHKKNLPEPDFDFRNLFNKGDIIYFVKVLPGLEEKEIKKLYLRTIYPRMMVGTEEKVGCQCIGYNEKDFIFYNLKDANDCFRDIQFNNQEIEADE